MPGRSGRPTPANVPSRWASAFTTVPLRAPGAGCTTMPGGLSIASRSASSKRTATGSGSGSAASGSGSGSSISSRAPTPRRWAPLRATPSTRTRPASINRFACDRVPTSATPARKRSRRTPAPPAGTTSSTRPGTLAAGGRTPRPGEGPAGEGRSHPDVEDGLAHAPVDLDADRVHAVRRQEEACAEVQVCGGEAERPPAAIARHHPAAERVGPAEERPRARHVARLEQCAEPRAAHLLAVARRLDRTHHLDLEPEACAERAQRFAGAGPVAPEVHVVADHDVLELEMAEQEVAH